MSMFPRAANNGGFCPICDKPIQSNADRYCIHCGEDVTGEWLEFDETPERDPDSLSGIVGVWAGGYIYVHLVKPGEPQPMLLVDVHTDYLTLSTSNRLVHIPFSSVFAVADEGGQCYVMLRHQYDPSTN